MTFFHNEYQLDMVLNINSVQVSDFGVYTCKVYNSYGQGIAVQMIQGKNIESFNKIVVTFQKYVLLKSDSIIINYEY